MVFALSFYFLCHVCFELLSTSWTVLVAVGVAVKVGVEWLGRECS